MNFGEKIKILIAMKGLTQEDFANIVGTSRTTVNTWISGRGEPNLDMVVSIANNFQDVSSDWLLGRSEKMSSDPFDYELLQKQYTALKEKYIKLLEHDRNKKRS